ncbi:MAG TPA: hypothetical protein VKX17_17040 [Planctomycetota bacterium]|nr:hypothetical protein [Planctomycetota bacterium]
MHLSQPRARLKELAAALITLSFWILPNTASHAMNLYSYDLDSLVYMSAEIVEATLGENYKKDNLSLVDVNITKVHKGSFKEGQTIAVTAMDFYRKSDGSVRKSAALERGDNVFMFLSKAGKTFLYDIPADAEIYWTAPSGLKLVNENKVLGFAQFDNPGPYVAMYEMKGKAPTIEEYRLQIANSAKKVNGWAAQFKAEPSPKDIPWLTALLKERVATWQREAFFSRDHIREMAEARIANLHDPDAINDALCILAEFRSDILARGLGTPAGREYMLKKIGNQQENIETRIRFAQMLYEAGYVYRSVNEKIASNSWKPTGKAEGENARYIARIAELALANQSHEKLCCALIHSIKIFASSIVQTKEPVTTNDYQSALVILKKLYDAKPSQEIQYEIELATSGNAAAYEKLGSSCGSIITKLRLPSAGQNFGELFPGEITIAYEAHTLANLELDEPSVVFADTNGKVLASAPLRGRYEFGHKGRQGGGSTIIRRPKSLPSGTYRIFLQFAHDGKVISEGHYCEIEI